MPNSPIHPGVVAWTGENPGIYLKDEQDGPWTGLMTFFRITWSEHGRGHGVLLLDDPNVEQSLPEVANFASPTMSRWPVIWSTNSSRNSLRSRFRLA